ncbi:MAG: hypothetical protein IT377_21195 [Polyangiaceae bacterium]|nr:hypothetical protein [Polyangiaceae bacterium]
MRIRGVALALPLVVSCHEHQPDPKLAPPPTASAAALPAPRVPTPEWTPVEPAGGHPSLSPTASDPDGGQLAQGQRVSKAGAAPQVATPPLTGGARVPAHAGGGFLFWSVSALYFAKSFLANLEPIIATSSAPSSVSFGAGYVIVHQTSGARFALSWPARRPAPMPVAGLVDVGTLADGRSVLLVEPDRVLTRGGGQKTWRDVTAEAGVVTQLHPSDTALWLARSDGTAARVEADGTLSRHDALPTEVVRPAPKTEDVRWPRTVTEAPLARAVRRGVPLDDRTALVEVAGAFAKVELGTGTLLSISPAVLASARECELLPVGPDVLALCRTHDGTHVVIGQTQTRAPKIERSFGSQGSFFTGSPGTLLFGGPCEARPNAPSAVCVRQRDGSWRELGGAQPTPGDAGPTMPAVSRWVPTPDGGALGLVSGSASGVYDAATGALAPFTADPRPQEHALFHPSRQLLVDDFAVADDGRIVGYLGSSSITLARDGRLERSPQRFTSLHPAGALALATDADFRLWQSSDYGRRWHEVARPPGSDARQALSLSRCSRVGCELSGWFRLGFRITEPRPTRLGVAERPASAALPRAPRLVCQRTSPPRTRWVTRTRSAEGLLTEEFDFGAKKVTAREGSASAIRMRVEAISDELSLGATLVEPDIHDTSSAGFRQAIGRNRSMRFTELLGDPKVVESRFSWQDVLTRAARESSDDPSGVATDERNALPVMGDKPGTTAGVLMRDPTGVLAWFRPGQPASVLSLGRENTSFVPQSALAQGKDELVVLTEDDSCAARVVSLTGAGARTLLELPARGRRGGCPANPDALARLDDGSFAIVRIPSAAPSSADDPALLLTPRSLPVSLAQWSTLTACSADAKGARATVALRGRWLELDAPGLAPSGDPFVFAHVRWNETRVCVESVAVEAPSVPIGDQELPTSVVVRFGPTPRADRRGFALGAEHTEELSCRLAP